MTAKPSPLVVLDWALPGKARAQAALGPEIPASRLNSLVTLVLYQPLLFGQSRRAVVGDDRRGLVDLEAGAGHTARGVAGEVGAGIEVTADREALNARRLGLGVGREGQGTGRVGAGDPGVAG